MTQYTDTQLPFFEWKIRVEYALVALGIFKRGNYGTLHFNIDEDSWKPLYKDGFSPIEAVYMSELDTGIRITHNLKN